MLLPGVSFAVGYVFWVSIIFASNGLPPRYGSACVSLVFLKRGINGCHLTSLQGISAHD